MVAWLSFSRWIRYSEGNVIVQTPHHLVVMYYWQLELTERPEFLCIQESCPLGQFFNSGCTFHNEETICRS